MVTEPKFVTKENRPFHVLLIPDEGNAQRLPQAWADADQALTFGANRAIVLYTCQTEVVVIETMKSEAVRNTMVNERES